MSHHNEEELGLGEKDYAIPFACCPIPLPLLLIPWLFFQGFFQLLVVSSSIGERRILYTRKGDGREYDWSIMDGSIEPRLKVLSQRGLACIICHHCCGRDTGPTAMPARQPGEMFHRNGKFNLLISSLVLGQAEKKGEGSVWERDRLRRERERERVILLK